MNNLIKDITKHSIEYGSIPFWSWNDKLEPERLREQIRRMNELKMRGFFMHARGGLLTEYMSDEWFEAISASVDEAKALGMEAWAYDENGWPSGFAGGKLLDDPDNFAVFVEGKITETFPEATEDTLAIYALDKDGKPAVTKTAVDGASSYLTVTIGRDGSYVDTMRRDVIDKFIVETHEVYKEKLGEDFGSAMPGFFTDEPQYYRWKTAYSLKMDEWFQNEYGYSVLLALPALFIDFEGASELRYDYYKMCSDKFTDAYSRNIYEWAEKNGIQITGHYVEEASLNGQMSCCADIMRQYPFEHIPGVDYLGRNLINDLLARQLGSVCEQLGRHKALSEMFACCGWDVTPKELKAIAELQYSGGVNLMCQHLYPYSIKGQRKRDYPAFYSEHLPWQDEMLEFNEYFNNLGYILSRGKEEVDTLVIHPIRSAWLTYQKDPVANAIPSTLNDELLQLSFMLSDNMIGYHFGCEAIMDDIATIEDGRIRIGEVTYKRLVIPACDTLNAKTVSLIDEFIGLGGEVYTFNRHLPTRIDGRVADLSRYETLPSLDADAIENIKNDECVVARLDTVPKHMEVRMQVRNTDYGRLIYITNLSDKDFENIRITVKNSKGLSRIDLLSLDYIPLRGKKSGKDTEIILSLYKGESAVLTDYKPLKMLPYDNIIKPEAIKLDTPFVADTIRDNMITLDRVMIAKGEGEFSEMLPIERVRDELLSERYEGRITLRYSFFIEDMPIRLRLICEPCPERAFLVNGKPIASLGIEHRLDREFTFTDLSRYIKYGENVIDVSLDYRQSDYVYYVLYGGVSESLRNCLVFDTEIESIYLFGDFEVELPDDAFRESRKGVYEVDLPKLPRLIGKSEHPKIQNLTKNGYPFYGGCVKARSTYTYKEGMPTALKLTGRFATAIVKVNGTLAGKILFTETLDLSGYLREGENEIEIEIKNAYRNLLGPHHYSDPEPMGVSPRHFSFEGRWNNGKCINFRDRYSFVKFGIDD